MQIAVYLNDNLYKHIDIGDSSNYSYSRLLKHIQEERKAGLLDHLLVDGKLAVNFVPEK